jgi:glutaconyl-CoA/methylmalonyl-CoA decarboxylase subunit delta
MITEEKDLDWSLILTVTIAGILIVFTSLVLLAICVYLYPKIIKRKKPKVIVPKISEYKEPAVTSDETDEELIAVITAAIAAQEGASYSSKIVVRSIRRARASSPVWNSVGRLEALN